MKPQISRELLKLSWQSMTNLWSLKITWTEISVAAYNPRKAIEANPNLGARDDKATRDWDWCWTKEGQDSLSLTSTRQSIQHIKVL